MRATLTHDELRSRHLGHHALRRFCAEMGVPVDAVKDVGDIGCIVGRAIGRVRAADRERAWKVAEAILTELDAQHFDESAAACGYAQRGCGLTLHSSGLPSAAAELKR